MKWWSKKLSRQRKEKKDKIKGEKKNKNKNLMLVISKCGIGNIKKKKASNYLNLHTNKTEFSKLDPKLC